MPVGDFERITLHDLDDAPNRVTCEDSVVWSQGHGFPTPTGFRVSVTSTAGAAREIIVIREFEIVEGVPTRLTVALTAVEFSEDEVVDGWVMLSVVAFNEEGDGPTASMETEDLVVDLAEAATSMITTGVAMTTVASVASSVVVSSGATVAAATTSAIATTTATTATTTTATTATTTTATTTTTTAGGGGSGGGSMAQGPSMMMLVSHLQFMALTSYQSGQYPRGTRAMGKSFVWATMDLGFPHSPQSPSVNAQGLQKGFQRNMLNDLPAHLVHTPEELIANTIVCLSGLIALLCVALGLFTIWKRVFGRLRVLGLRVTRLKILQLGLRIVHVGYFGLAFASFNQLVHGSSTLHSVVAAGILVVVVIGLPATHVAVNFAPENLTTRLGAVLRVVARITQPVLADFRPNRRLFVVAVLCRALASSLALSVVGGQSLAQSYSMLFVNAVYFSLLGCSPYSSKLVMRIDVLMSTIDCTTLCVPLLLNYYPGLMKKSATLQWLILSLNLLVVLLYMLYAGIMLARQVSLLIRKRSVDWNKERIQKMLEWVVDETEDESGDEITRTRCRPSSDFHMEPRHRVMWEAAMRNAERKSSGFAREASEDMSRCHSVSFS